MTLFFSSVVDVTHRLISLTVLYYCIPSNNCRLFCDFNNVPASGFQVHMHTNTHIHEDRRFTLNTEQTNSPIHEAGAQLTSVQHREKRSDLSTLGMQ